MEGESCSRAGGGGTAGTVDQSTSSRLRIHLLQPLESVSTYTVLSNVQFDRKTMQATNQNCDFTKQTKTVRYLTSSRFGGTIVEVVYSFNRSICFLSKVGREVRIQVMQAALQRLLRTLWSKLSQRNHNIHQKEGCVCASRSFVHPPKLQSLPLISKDPFELQGKRRGKRVQAQKQSIPRCSLDSRSLTVHLIVEPLLFT